MGLRIQVAIKTQALIAISNLSLTLRESSHAKRRQLALGILERAERVRSYFFYTIGNISLQGTFCIL